MSLGSSQSSLPQRSSCAVSAVCTQLLKSGEADSDHSSKLYRRFNRSTCCKDEVKVRIGNFKGRSEALMLLMFLIEFEVASEIAGWSYRRKGQELRTRLKGQSLMAVQGCKPFPRAGIAQTIIP
jgi:hypothetical protein